MLILGIESSCDETSIALVRDGKEVLSCSTSSSEDVFREAGGVIPEEAARKQVEVLLPVLHKCLSDGCTEIQNIDAIAVTKGPGLLGSLIVGTASARTLASLWKKPLIGVHHTLGHLSSTWLECEEEVEFPVLALSVSGGHTDIWHRTSHTSGTLLGHTLDDAAGEAFDKGATLLSLPYPGGPSISKAAADGDANAYSFPLPMHDSEDFHFSFSGLKTALKYILRDNPHAKDDLQNLSASYQEAICRHLVDKVKRASEMHKDVKEVHIVGGVSANMRLREMVQEACSSTTVRWPKHIRFCTDNAAMIASAAYFFHEEQPDGALESFTTEASLSLSDTHTN